MFEALRQDHAPGGLQVQAPDGGWIDVPGCGLVRDQSRRSIVALDQWPLEVEVHRVVNSPRDVGHSTRRISIVFFTGLDAIIECLPSCRSAEKPPHYPVVRAWDHFMEKVRASMETGAY